MYQQEKIDLYLNNKMSPEEQQLFQQEMDADKELAEAVELQRDMARFFETQEPEMEQQLSELGNQYFGQEKSGSALKKWGWVLPVLLIGFLLAKWLMPEDVPAPEPNQSLDTIEVDSMQMERKNETEAPTEDKTGPSEDSLPDVSKNTEQDPPPAKKPAVQDRPIATVDQKAYEVNPLLETLLAENVRNSTVTQVFTPSPDTFFRFQQPIPLVLRGNTTAQPPLELLIYSNRPFDFDNDYPLLKQPLSSEEKDGLYQFWFNAKVPLKNGLYYWMIRSVEKEEVLYLSKFSIE